MTNDLNTKMTEKYAFYILIFISLNSIKGHVHNAVETEMFAIPISPNIFNWTYQEFDQQYRFHAALVGKPDLPPWMRYIYSGRHHSGFIFGTPPRGTKSTIMVEVIGLNRQDYETRRLLLTLKVKPRDKMAKHEVELKIDNLNVEDLLDEHRMMRLKEIFRTKLWSESSEDLYPTFLSSAIDLGARLPLKPNDGEGLVVRLGSTAPFSAEIIRLREEVRPLSKLTHCPRDYKRTSVERNFRDAGLTLDWCSFELYNTIYKDRTTEHIEYLSEIPNNLKKSDSMKANVDSSRLPSGHVWSAPNKRDLPSRSYLKEFMLAIVLPLLLMLVSMAALTAVVCFHYAGMPDPESEYFYENIFHICIEYKSRRVHSSGKVELCRYGTGNTEQSQVADNTSGKSLVEVSPNNSLVRPYSPKSSTNLAANYNRPQPPPYMGSTNNSLHHRKSGNPDKTTPSTSTHTPEHNRGHLVLEESLKLLNEANISSLEYVDGIDGSVLKDRIVDLVDGCEDYVPIKPEGGSYVPMNQNLDDIVVPELSKYGLTVGMIGQEVDSLTENGIAIKPPVKTWFC